MNNIWKKVSSQEKEQIYNFAEEYKRFLNLCKTEREVVNYITSVALENGYKDGFSNKSEKLIFSDKERIVALYKKGVRSQKGGFNIIVSHIDSPRIDLKPRPIYEDSELVLLDTQYYGGIKKYQWFSIPLAIHGVILNKYGRKQYIVIGEDNDDPVFTIADLLPHLSRKVQGNKPIDEALPGEKLDVLFGSVPMDGEKEEEIKKYALHILKEKYEIEEEDLVSADIEIVPAFKARDVGIDKSLIGGYGQDDRICVFCSLKALMDIKENIHPILLLFVDREEIGSFGNTSAKSKFLEIVVKKILEMEEDIKPYDVEISLYNSRAISADVTSAVNPNFKEVDDLKNSAKLGHGVAIVKYTGSGGKYYASEASAEYTSYIRNLFNKNGVIWQTGILGKVDEGGGGTVAMFLAEYGMDIIDVGPPILNMHSPFEISSKADLFMTYKAYKVFLESE
ncbi:MAG: aminopeptidase [candidate division WOR-3 bacterium]|nr:aminopeptidase [candidate division WOR-3 bacterium]MCX7947737.1 aminopeptidase [candidate division WOR-3 bacterium]MDW8150340.1 aminopeptidase [candidate division WOR-3 bacterium]